MGILAHATQIFAPSARPDAYLSGKSRGGGYGAVHDLQAECRQGHLGRSLQGAMGQEPAREGRVAQDKGQANGCVSASCRILLSRSPFSREGSMRDGLFGSSDVGDQAQRYHGKLLGAMDVADAKNPVD